MLLRLGTGPGLQLAEIRQCPGAGAGRGRDAYRRRLSAPKGRGELRDQPPCTRARHTTEPPPPIAASHRNEPGEIPNSADNARSPDGVTFTARAEPTRTHHPASSACR